MKKFIILGIALFFFVALFNYSLAVDLPIPETGLPNPTGGIRTILVRALNWLLGILGIISIIAFVVSGIMYLLSAGSDEAIKRAKKGMTASIIGVAVGLGGFIVVKAIDTLLRAQSNI